jgi:hypothetical protein
MEFMFLSLYLLGQIFSVSFFTAALRAKKHMRKRRRTNNTGCNVWWLHHAVLDKFMTNYQQLRYAISQPRVMTSHSYVSNDGYVSGVSAHLTAICKSGHAISSRTSDSLHYAQKRGSDLGRK